MKPLTQKTLEKLQTSFKYEDLTAIDWKFKYVQDLNRIKPILQDDLIYMDASFHNAIIKYDFEFYKTFLKKLLNDPL